MAAGALIVIFIVVLGVVVFGGFFGATGLARAGRSRSGATEDGLSFPVPNGVDPSVVVDAMTHDGYDATQGEDDTHQPVVVIRGGASGTPDREEVRSALQRVPFRDGDQPAGVPIRFSDE